VDKRENGIEPGRAVGAQRRFQLPINEARIAVELAEREENEFADTQVLRKNRKKQSGMIWVKKKTI